MPTLADVVAELRQRTAAAEARAERLAGELAGQHERLGRLEGERDAARGGGAPG